MAFVQVETWQALPCAGRASRAVPALGPDAQRLLSHPAAIFISIVVYLCLLWLLMHGLRPGADVPVTLRPAPWVIDLVGLSEGEAGPPPASPVAVLPPSQPVASALDLTVPSELPPPEWSMSAIRVARPAAQAAAPMSLTASTGAAAGSGTGGGGYDPYAGAAPLPLSTASAARSAPQLDRAMLEVLLAAIRRRPDGRGTADLLVRVSDAGIVLDASPAGGTASGQAMAALRAALIGRKLFTAAPGAAPSLVRLAGLRLS